ncbi:hypothetical protein DB345_10805 [Spartobacteria bacterium LR76]|nr:hypothetical protein DB345_10805 [Spartobacteria bacterium LR76]
MTEAELTIPSVRGWRKPSLSTQIFLGLILGGVFGWAFPAIAVHGELLKDIFLNLIKMMVGPLVFASIVQGIAGGGDLKRVGRIGLKSVVYFEIITTLALLVGLVFANVIRPGQHVALHSSAAIAGVPAGKPQTVTEMILHAVPTSVFDALARSDVLQIVTFSVIFAIALSLAGKAGEPILKFTEGLTQVMFKFAGLVMLFAPLGVAGAMAFTIAKNGTGILLSLGALVGTVYLAFLAFLAVVLGSVMLILRIPVMPFLRAVKEPCLIAFGTTNSESALPKAFQAMEKFGVPKGIVGFVLPTGYTFNLDGAAVYLTVAIIFISQAAANVTGVTLTWWQQILMVLTLMVTSKGVAAVPRAAIVVLVAALHTFGLPLEGAALLIGIDAILDMGRSAVNVFGNCLASVVVAKWEGEFDQEQALSAYGSPSLSKST